jgi:hypothetical protein
VITIRQAGLFWSFANGKTPLLGKCREIRPPSFQKKEDLVCSQRYAERGVYFVHFGIGQGCDKIGKQGFWQADKFITINGAVIFKPFVRTTSIWVVNPSYFE